MSSQDVTIGHGRYQVEKTLGSGAFGVALKCTDTTNHEVIVVKRINIQNIKVAASAANEVAVLKALTHPCIIGYKESFSTKGFMWIAMEYCPRGDLAVRIKAQLKRRLYFNEKRVMRWFTQVCLGLQYCHDQKVLHRDLAAKNVFLTEEDDAKIGDFGISRQLQWTFQKAQTTAGTPCYMSPELINGKAYDSSSDVWSLGCLLYELCALRRPFDASSMTALADLILSGTFAPLPSCYSSELRELVGRLLTVTSSDRPSVTAILELPYVATYVGELRRRLAERAARASSPASPSTPPPSPASMAGGPEVPPPTSPAALMTPQASPSPSSSLSPSPSPSPPSSAAAAVPPASSPALIPAPGFPAVARLPRPVVPSKRLRPIEVPFRAVVAKKASPSLSPNEAACSPTDAAPRGQVGAQRPGGSETPRLPSEKGSPGELPARGSADEAGTVAVPPRYRGAAASKGAVLFAAAGKRAGRSALRSSSLTKQAAVTPAVAGAPAAPNRRKSGGEDKKRKSGGSGSSTSSEELKARVRRNAALRQDAESGSGGSAAVPRLGKATTTRPVVADLKVGGQPKTAAGSSRPHKTGKDEKAEVVKEVSLSGGNGGARGLRAPLIKRRSRPLLKSSLWGGKPSCSSVLRKASSDDARPTPSSDIGGGKGGGGGMSSALAAAPPACPLPPPSPRLPFHSSPRAPPCGSPGASGGACRGHLPSKGKVNDTDPTASFGRAEALRAFLEGVLPLSVLKAACSLAAQERLTPATAADVDLYLKGERMGRYGHLVRALVALEAALF